LSITTRVLASSGAATDHALRGDYSRMAADFSVPQEMARYRPEHHALWRFLFDRQAALAKTHACRPFLDGLADLDVAGGIPDFARASRILRRATGWELIAVPGLIPNDAFFAHLAHRRFPVSWWIRDESEVDYLVEPDVFHDFFGHVPLLAHPVFADYMQIYGEQGLKALAAGEVKKLSRLYWYMVEFGLIREAEGLRAFGAGILSSYGETRHAVESGSAYRVHFDLARVLRSEYRLDRFQAVYFVLDDFRELFEASRGDLLPVYRALGALPDLEAGERLPEDRVLGAG
jgi:phenylalanine-4-hydroxylase